MPPETPQATVLEMAKDRINRTTPNLRVEGPVSDSAKARGTSFFRLTWA